MDYMDFFGNGCQLFTHGLARILTDWDLGFVLYKDYIVFGCMFLLDVWAG